MSLINKFREKTNEVFKETFDMNLEELLRLEPVKLEDAVEDFDREIERLKKRLDELDKEKREIANDLEEKRRYKKELSKKLRKSKI